MTRGSGTVVAQRHLVYVPPAEPKETWPRTRRMTRLALGVYAAGFISGAALMLLVS